MHATYPVHLLFLALIILFGKEYKLCNSSLCSFFSTSVPCSQTPSVYVLPLKSETMFHIHTKQ
jgi:hypothetical protein